METQESAPIGNDLCYLQFYVIDNQVKVYVNDELIDDSGYRQDIEEDYMVSVSKYLTDGTNKITIEVYNGRENASFDQKWQVQYELIYDGIPVDYMSESSTDGKTGLVLTEAHEITVE